MVQTCPVHAHPKLFEGEFFNNPYQLYADLHADGRPIEVCLVDNSPVWMVTRYEDVHAGLRDRRLARPRKYAGPQFITERLPEGVRVGGLVYTDPPEHTRLRRFVSHVFLPKNIERLRPRIQEVIDGLLDKMAEKSEAELVREFAVPLPATMISEIIGIPHKYVAEMKEWSDLLLGGTDEENAHVQVRVREMIMEMKDDKIREPKDDLMSHWMFGKDKDGVGLHPQEVSTFVGAVLFAGFDTTAGTISNAVLALFDHPELLQRIKEDPDQIPQAAEELIRVGTAVHNGFRRFATEDLEIGGVTIKSGDTVYLNLAAANRDPDIFTDPDILDVDRDDVSKHIAFGGGPHFCTGADLGRLEIQLSLRSLLARFPDISLAVPREELKWRTSPNIITLADLPVKY
ncbi:cytochrome P450 [Micromonospora sp. WMMD1082]|uniref:cytochrome P450 family protein n=1 Tax=Micromonospora sp. WMMD1082 TaxID=3016104 RepID=UPI0024171EFE|nr:cytochrome P450 [Micromonospora sp. WMMD1082]MDG4794568.1 cytochrome P450 [Micromonospora sp. WMMD1082]